MPWMRYKLRDAEVWAKVDAAGALIAEPDGRVEVVYKNQPGAKVYRAGAKNLVATGGEPIEIEVGEKAPEKGAPAKAAASARSRRPPTRSTCGPTARARATRGPRRSAWS